MAHLSIDYSKIKLQENIPLNVTDIATIERLRNAGKKIPLIVALICLLVINCIYWFRDNHKAFTNTNYLIPGGVTILGLSLLYFLIWLMVKYSSLNHKKDIASGKSILTSILIDKENNKYGVYFTFATPQKKNKIRITTNIQNYKQYQKGDKLVVVYLKHTRLALQIKKAQL